MQIHPSQDTKQDFMMQEGLLLRSVALALCLGLAAGGAVVWQADPAWSQDDDGGDDDGGDDDGGDDDGGGDDSGGGGAGGGADDDGDDAGGGDDDDGGTGDDDDDRAGSVASDDAAQADGQSGTADLATLLGLGFRVIEERPVPEIGVVSRRLAIPAGSTIDAARDQVRALASGGDADFNHFYRSEEAPTLAVCEGQHCASLEQIGWQAPDGPLAACATDVVIGVIDTGINPDHAAFSDAQLDVHRMAPESLDPSRAIHGTAVVSLLVGNPESRSPGLLPEARVVAVDAFHSDEGDERADVYTLTAAMNYLADRGVRVINMSLAGPPNSVLEAATAALVERGIIIVAAVGNGGPKSEPAYPAAYPGVIAVTAVDSGDTIYRRAGQGPHVDLAAPGVEVWTAASVSGARPKTGTSFAAPFVTAAVASVLDAKPDLGPEALIAELAASARDLGDPGRDDVYGFGLMQANGPCGRLPGP
jgi:minor extracellular protease Epr